MSFRLLLSPGSRDPRAVHEHAGIVCLECGAKSYNLNDVLQCFCQRCNKFHDPHPWCSEVRTDFFGPRTRGEIVKDEDEDGRTLTTFSLEVPMLEVPTHLRDFRIEDFATTPAIQGTDAEDTLWELRFGTWVQSPGGFHVRIGGRAELYKGGPLGDTMPRARNPILRPRRSIEL